MQVTCFMRSHAELYHLHTKIAADILAFRTEKVDRIVAINT